MPNGIIIPMPNGIITVTPNGIKKKLIEIKRITATHKDLVSTKNTIYGRHCRCPFQVVKGY
jgi:hypothetical protein